jgi:hypothetical protein
MYIGGYFKRSVLRKLWPCELWLRFIDPMHLMLTMMGAGAFRHHMTLRYFVSLVPYRGVYPLLGDLQLISFTDDIYVPSDPWVILNPGQEGLRYPQEDHLRFETYWIR